MLPIKMTIDEQFMEEETRNGYRVEKEKKKLWAIELDLLQKLNQVCTKYNIEYYACAGTLLGAVRHKGMIPWDDDIDVMMTRDNYNRLCSVGKEFDYPYFFQTEDTDPGSLRGHAQLRNSLTTGIISYESEASFSFNQGIFIDIFPLDYLPENPAARKRFLHTAARLRWVSKMFRDIPAHPNASKERWKRVIRNTSIPFLKMLDQKGSASHRINKIYESFMAKYQDKPTGVVGIVSLYAGKEQFIWDTKDIKGETKNIPFEFMQIPVPCGYDRILTKTYGDWQKPVKSTSGHGGIIFDTEIPYTEYIKNK